MAEFRRSVAEAIAMIESGAHDVDPDSADYLLAEMVRSPSPMLTGVAVAPGPTSPVPLAWREAVPISLLQDTGEFELGRARVLRRMDVSGGLSTFVIMGSRLAQKSTDIFMARLGENNPWTILSWLAANRDSIEVPSAVERCERGFGP